MKKIYVVFATDSVPTELISPGFSTWNDAYSFLKKHCVKLFGEESWRKKVQSSSSFHIQNLKAPKKPWNNYEISWIKIL